MLTVENFSAPPLLTNRENEILEYVAIGDSAKEAAIRMQIAPRTVERHIENIRLKMHAKNRAHMVMCAVFQGLLKVDG
jgi:DNA-binding CsgD family transcriptional regulator